MIVVSRFVDWIALCIALGGCSERATGGVASSAEAEAKWSPRAREIPKLPSSSRALTSTTRLASVPREAELADSQPRERNATVELSIPPRKQAAESPPSGWCGETAIQEALLYFGVWASQRHINRAGKPKHPDLYSSDIPVALHNLGVEYEFYSRRPRGLTKYLAWIQAALKRGEPVLAGVKLLPTQHPEWGLDHFVLVVGYGPRGLLVNTTWGHRAWANDTTDSGISFKNVTYGIRLRGVVPPGNGIGARLSIVDERENAVKLRVICGGLTTGTTYRIEQWSSASDQQPLRYEATNALDQRIEKLLSLDPTHLSRFSCARQ